MADRKHITPYQRAIIGLFLLAALSPAAGGYWFYRHEVQVIRDTKYNELKAIAMLKCDQIAAWRQDRMAQARVNSGGDIRSFLLLWLKAPGNDSLKSKIVERMTTFQREYFYKNVILVHPKDYVPFSFNPSPADLDPADRQLAIRAVSSREVVFGDFYRSQVDRHVHLDLAAPILDDEKRPVAVMILQVNPEKYLYPLLQWWPMTSRSAETLLIRKEGGKVLFLNPLRHRPEQALTLSIPLSQAEVPAVQAAFGKTGLFEGRDYRGVDVLADILPVQGTPWFMVAKVDRDEILVEASYLGRVVFLFVVLSILMTGLMAAFVVNYRRRKLYQNLFRAEKEQRKAQEEMRVILYSIGDAVIAANTEGLITHINPVAEQLTGWSESEALGRPLKQVFHIINEETRAEVENPVERVLREGAVVGLANHTLLIARDGTERPVADIGAPIRGEKREISGVVLVFRDQTEDRAAQRALQEEKAIAQRYLDIAGVMMLALDPSADVILINKKGCEILGYEKREILGKNWFDHFIPLRVREEIKSVFSRVIQGDAELNEFVENPVLCRSGGERLIAWHNTVVRDEDDRVVTILSSGEDITEHKRIEEERASLEEQLRQSQKMEAIGRLAGGVAHDFNNLLTVISGHCELSLFSLAEGDPVRANIEEIKKASDRAAGLTHQLLAFSRKQIMEMKVLDLNEVLQRLDKMLRRIIGEDIELLVIPGEPIGLVKADPWQIEQVVMNLAVNARDAMPNGGKLTIATANVELDEAYSRKHLAVQPGRYVMLSVSDTGMGMTPEIMDRVLEPFFTTKEPGKGTGLGLSTVYGIVKQSGGNIWLYSEPGRGTTFKIYLPQADEALEGLKEETAGEVPRGDETILVVEDEETVRKLAVRILKKQGYKVLEASGGDEALLRCKEFEDSIHLILTDVVMPGMSGKKLVDRLQKIYPEIKVLYMSGYTDNAIHHHGVLDPGTNFIQKPFTIDGLARKMREVLDKD
jgi:two-component system cell cycle sensor histidine kinase/response regulator CckA